MTIVARPTKHSIAAVDLTWEEDTIAIEWKKCILQLMEGLEVLRPSHPDSRAMIAIAPRDKVATIDLCHSWVVAIDPLPNLRYVTVEDNLIRGDVPRETILTKSHVETHPSIGVVAAEDPGIPVLEWDYCTIEYAVTCRCLIPTDYGVFAVSPERGMASLRAILPRHIGERSPLDFDIIHSHLFSEFITISIVGERYYFCAYQPRD